MYSACRRACGDQLVAIKFQTATGRTFASLQYGTAISAVMGNVSVAALQLAFNQYRIGLIAVTVMEGLPIILVTHASMSSASGQQQHLEQRCHLFSVILTRIGGQCNLCGQL